MKKKFNNKLKNYKIYWEIYQTESQKFIMYLLEQEYHFNKWEDLWGLWVINRIPTS